MGIFPLILSLFFVPIFAFAQVNPVAVESRKSELQEELKAYEKQIGE